jgi:hypothetical protein
MALWTVAGVVLALPHYGKIFGTIVPLPHFWLFEMLPVVGALRAPTRLGVVGLVSLSLLTGLAFGEVVRRVLPRWQPRPRGRLIRGALAAVIAAAILEQPRTGLGYPPGFVIKPPPRAYRLRKVPRGMPYAAILRSGRGPLLEIGRRDPTTEAIAMVRSIDHWRPLLNGYGSYWPKQYERSMWLAGRLPEDLRALNTLRTETGVELILVWPRQLPPGKRAAWQLLARSGGNPSLALVGAGELETLLFRVTGA